jgi:hypothetical protein
MSESVRHQLNRKLLLVGAALGLAYGLVLRFAFQATFLNRFGGLMAWAFLLGVPFAMGFITIFVIQRREPQPFWVWIVWPWIPILGGAVGSFLALIEGVIASQCFCRLPWPLRRLAGC